MFDTAQPMIVVPKADAAAERSFFNLSLHGLFAVLWRKRFHIAAVALACACLAVVIGKSLSPRYTATAQLYIDPRELQLVERELTPRSQDMTGLTLVAESQARLLTSNSVLLKVIENTDIENDPEFGGKSTGLFSSLTSLFSGAAKGSVDQTATLDALNRHINVKRNDRSFIVDVEVWSVDPAKAAMLANAVTTAYLSEAVQSQASAARRATTDLSGRLKELQARLRTAENTLATYKAKNNFIGTQDTLVSDQQLSAITQRLATARAQTLDAQAKYDQIETSRRNAADAGAIPEALQSQTIASLRGQYAEARKRYAEMSNEFGPRHPARLNMERQVDDLRRTINEEVNRYAQAAKNDLARSKDYEASLVKVLDEQKRQSVDLSQASVRLRELERDVEASRAVYLSFLKRSRETEEQETLNTSSARVIGEATAPRRRTFPPAMSLLAMVGFVVGALGASAFVVASEGLVLPDANSPGPKPAPRSERTELATVPRPKSAPSLLEKPLIARLRDSDIMPALGAILAASGRPDTMRATWPMVRTDTAFGDDLQRLLATAARKAPSGATPVLAVIAPADCADHTMIAVNAALSAARHGTKVMMIDADAHGRALSAWLSDDAPRSAASRKWFGFGTHSAALPIPVAQDIDLTPLVQGADQSKATQHAIAQVRMAGTHGMIVVDGPAMPWSEADRVLLASADALVAVLPIDRDINACMDDIIAALDGAERKLIGVVLNELSPAGTEQRGKQYA